MQRVMALDSVVMQALGDDVWNTAKNIETALEGRLEVVKCSPVYPTKEARTEWRRIIGTTLPKSAVFVALLHHQRGQSIPLIQYRNSKGLEVHFHGLQQYEKIELVLNDGAIQRGKILDELIDNYNGEMRIVRLDRSLDLIGLPWRDYSNTKVHRSLSKREGTAVFKRSTVYYQPPKPRYVKVLAYDKQKANTLAYPLTRIEYSFKGQYWRKYDVIPINQIIEMAKQKTDGYIHKSHAR